MIDCTTCVHFSLCTCANHEKDECVYYEPERPHGEWIVNFDNGVKFGTIDLKCPKCGHCAICPKVDIPNFCGKCGADMRQKEGES